MATGGEEEVEYESDPEEAKRSLAMRRREASDDEEGEEDRREKPTVDRRVGIRSDESDGQGGAADYEDDEELGVEDDEEEEEIDEEEEEVEEGDEEEEEEEYHESGREGETEHVAGAAGVESPTVAVPKETYGDERRAAEDSVNEHAGAQAEDEEEKKENEPFAVPTAGAFYMHDDRFRDNAGGRHRYGYSTQVKWVFCV